MLSLSADAAAAHHVHNRSNVMMAQSAGSRAPRQVHRRVLLPRKHFCSDLLTHIHNVVFWSRAAPSHGPRPCPHEVIWEKVFKRKLDFRRPFMLRLDLKILQFFISFSKLLRAFSKVRKSGEDKVKYSRKLVDFMDWLLENTAWRKHSQDSFRIL